jgi:hypothetical protein
MIRLSSIASFRATVNLSGVAIACPPPVLDGAPEAPER